MHFKTHHRSISRGQHFQSRWDCWLFLVGSLRSLVIVHKITRDRSMKRYLQNTNKQRFQFKGKRLQLHFLCLPSSYNLWWTIGEVTDEGMKPFGNPGVSFKMTSPGDRKQSNPILKPHIPSLHFWRQVRQDTLWRKEYRLVEIKCREYTQQMGSFYVNF